MLDHPTSFVHPKSRTWLILRRSFTRRTCLIIRRAVVHPQSSSSSAKQLFIRILLFLSTCSSAEAHSLRIFHQIIRISSDSPEEPYLVYFEPFILQNKLVNHNPNLSRDYYSQLTQGLVIYHAEDFVQDTQRLLRPNISKT